MDVLLKYTAFAGGVYHLLFGTFHLLFPSALKWGDSLRDVDRTNRNLLYVFNLWIAFAIYSWSFLSFAFPEELVGTGVGRGLCGCIAGIWVFRYLMQIYYMGFGGAYEFPVKFWGMQRIAGPVFVPVFGLGIGLYLVPLLRGDLRQWLSVGAAMVAAMLLTYVVHRRVRQPLQERLVAGTRG